MSLSFFTAALSAWRAGYAGAPDDTAIGESFDAVVKLSIKTIEGARTAETLGAEREGTGVVLDDNGLIVTIGYLILEAASILVVTGDGRIFPASIIGFDHATGFGVLRSKAGLVRHPLELGTSASARELHLVTVAAHAAAGGCSRASIVSLRRFTGWWEYMLDEGIFTAPPRYEHSGAALIDAAGKLIGIGSLWVSDALAVGAAFPGNMFVPTDLLRPLLADLSGTERNREQARPWLGVYSEELEGHLVITHVLPDSPAARAGMRRGDVILGVEGESVGDQCEFYQRVWASGAAGTVISLHVLQNKKVKRITVHSTDRLDYLRPWTVA